MADAVLILCILLSAYFIRGITGFGSGPIAVPLLALSQPLQFAIPLVLALDFTASIALGSLKRREANWGEIKLPRDQQAVSGKNGRRTTGRVDTWRRLHLLVHVHI